MEIVLATNFDDRLLDGVRELPVADLFGGFPVSLTGAGRPPYILPEVSRDRFRQHVDRVHQSGRRFLATVNSADLGLKEYTAGYLDRFRREMAELLDLGVDGFVVALPVLIDTIHREWPEVPISVSTFARVRTVNQAEYFLRLGARTIVLEEANRDFPLVRGLVDVGANVEILVNQTCIRDCPYRAHHLNTSSLCSQPDAAPLRFELPILQCGMEVVRDPTKLISSIWVRPEDLRHYEVMGVRRFKVSGRNRPTEWLVRAARAYAARSYPGNLLDILSFVQVKGPRQAITPSSSGGELAPGTAELRRAFDRLAGVTIDNRAFPPNFFQTLAGIDCEHRSCARCGYCARVARRVVRLEGEPLPATWDPGELPAAGSFLPQFGSEAGATSDLGPRA